jgi:SPP1 family predicted phage head-tail adaptor
MALAAGKLRHRIEIQRPVHSQNPETGADSVTWSTVPGCASVPAAINPLSGREFMAAQAQQSEIVARIVIRAREGLNATMRALHRGKVYQFAGPPLADVDSGLEYFTIPVSEGVIVNGA